jgi:hypothetical protein
MNTILKDIGTISAAAAKESISRGDADVVLKLCQAATELTKAWATIEDISIHRQFHEKQETFIPGEDPLVNPGH